MDIQLDFYYWFDMKSINQYSIHIYVINTLNWSTAGRL